MKDIKTPVDASEFDEKIVAFQASHSYYGTERKGFNVTKDKSLRFAMIDKYPNSDGTFVYNASILLKPDEVPSNNKIIPPFIGNSEMFRMRLATCTELSAISQAISNGSAEFEYEFDKNQVLHKIKQQSSDQHCTMKK